MENEFEDLFENNFKDHERSRDYMEMNYTCEILDDQKLKELKGIKVNNNYNINSMFLSTVNSLNLNKTTSSKHHSQLIDAPYCHHDSLSLSQMVIYSLPSFGKMSCLVILNIHALLFYESMGTSLLYLSFFVALARAFEILLKPIIAYLSDETKSKYGRRKPYMFVGCFFYAIFLIFLFYPPSMRAGATYIAMWFGIFYVLFFVADTVTNVPYLALGPELSRDSKEREKLYIFFYLFQYLGVLFASAAPVIINRYLPACDCSFCYNNPQVTDVDHCVKQCKIFCQLKNNRSSLLDISFVIGVFFVASIILLCYKIREHKSYVHKEKTHFIPSLNRLMYNKPFVKILLPWIIDVLITTIFATMLPFFLNFVINPQKYCIKNGIDLNSEECSVNLWLGYSISIFFIGCIIFTLVWHYLVSIFGKKKCWELYSLISIFTFSLFLLCEEGSIGTLIFASICCALPGGGIYLNDVLVSDAIEYDEFYTGRRNEGLYTVFTTFIPKIVSIFAQSIPLTIMACLGFVPSDNGYTQDQPQAVVNFIKFFFIGIPCILALISFIFKLQYPISSDVTMIEIRNAINIQKENAEYLRNKCDCYKIVDPVFGNYHMQIFINNDVERDTKLIVDHFYHIKYLKIIYKKDFEHLKSQVKFNIFGSVILLIVFIITLIATFTFLKNKSLSLVPLSSLFIVSISIVMLIINWMRYSVIKKLIRGEYKIDHNFLKLLILKMVCEDYDYYIKNKREDLYSFYSKTESINVSEASTPLYNSSKQDDIKID